MKRLVLAITLASLAAVPHRGAQDARDLSRYPGLSVSCPDVVNPGVPVTFTVNVGEAPGDAKLTFNWVVSAGTITSGQGTTSITVDTTGVVANGVVTATVEVGGLPESCPKSTSCTSAIPQSIFHDKVDEYGNIKFADEKARLDNLAIELQNVPEFVGYLVGYGGRRSRRGEASRRIERAKRYLVAVRGIDAARVVTVDGGYREDLTVELKVRHKTLPPPEPFATVDPKDVIFIRLAPQRRARRR